MIIFLRLKAILIFCLLSQCMHPMENTEEIVSPASQVITLISNDDQEFQLAKKFAALSKTIDGFFRELEVDGQVLIK